MMVALEGIPYRLSEPRATKPAPAAGYTGSSSIISRGLQNWGDSICSSLTLDSLSTFSSHVLHRPSRSKSRKEAVTVTLLLYAPKHLKVCLYWLENGPPPRRPSSTTWPRRETWTASASSSRADIFRCVQIISQLFYSRSMPTSM
jgi:hypothetical protein